MPGPDGPLSNCNEKINPVVSFGQEFLHSFFGPASNFMDWRFRGSTGLGNTIDVVNGEIPESAHGDSARNG